MDGYRVQSNSRKVKGDRGERNGDIRWVKGDGGSWRVEDEGLSLKGDAYHFSNLTWSLNGSGGKCNSIRGRLFTHDSHHPVQKAISPEEEHLSLAVQHILHREGVG